ncbi:Phospholipid-binding protein [Candidatus Burkholderia verschuerenii]|uniref:Phospholipid-binding protein n=1 Tax=Candidatus Burkholderia verschuerenii TaxID=242163 RepID=A0A0L0M6L4_9BURK|nr:YbhB/YbcL family Raf kinase inhibitor-like protein [Candidatus Burkholderia verschuerenii]KND57931.1 Phospholipid-binding protein [Candidatus Burkholderia verschuerenii]
MRLACRIVSSGYRVGFAVCVASAVSLLSHSRDASADPAFTVSSIDLAPGKTIGRDLLFDNSECKGGNRSPQLSWRGAPEQTRSYAITIYDPDAPGRGWYHWAVAGIPVGVTHLAGNASASGALRKTSAVEARNDWDTDGYGGPCPPAGKPHRYVVTVYALRTDDLRLRQGTPALMFEHEIRTASIATAQLTFTVGR